MTSRNVLRGSILMLCGSCFIVGAAWAQDAQDAADLAKTIQNPVASMVTLPIQVNWNRGIGDYDRTGMNMNIQPVVPFAGSGNWDMITRTIVPLNSVPIGETGSVFGIGDTSFNLFFVPKNTGKMTWGIGPSLTLPTASNGDVLGSQKWSIGPTGVVFYGTGSWTMGIVASNVWSFAGEDDREDVNLLVLQYFVNYNLGNGWAVGAAPIITANWEAESDQQWTIPFGLQVSKVMRFGNQPVNLLLGYYENSEHPDGGAESQVRFQINLLYPN